MFVGLLDKMENNQKGVQTNWLYAVKAQTSLAPLSRFCGSCITTAHEQQCCRFQLFEELCAIVNEIDKEIDKA